VADLVWLMGYDPDPAKPGEFLPGARVVEQYDLAAMDLCWHKDISHDTRFMEFANTVKQRFQTLR
jgi:hypothetical protein